MPTMALLDKIDKAMNAGTPDGQAQPVRRTGPSVEVESRLRSVTEGGAING